jgi:hypothetical protein
MRSLSSLGGRVKKKSGSELDSNRYSFLSLDQAEPDFGIPDSDKAILLSDADGSRLFGKFSSGLTIDANGIVTVNEETVPVNTSGYSYSTGSTLAAVLQSLDSAIALAASGELVSIISDYTLNGAGSLANPLSVDSANIVNTIINAGYATQTFVTTRIDSAVNQLVDGAIDQLDTLNELAEALNNDSNFAGTVTSLIATKLAIANFDSYFDSAFSAKSTSDLTEGSNLYYTTIRFDSDFSDKTTSDLTEGSNLYYTKSRVDSDFDTRLAIKTTTDLTEGSNLYYTKTRVDSDIIALVDEAYIDARIAIDSAFIADLIDSAYVASIISEDYVKGIADSAYINSLVDSVSEATNALTLNNQAASYYLDYNNFANTPTNVSDFTNDANYLDSTTVLDVVDSNYIKNLIDSVYVNSLNIDADLLDGQTGGYYLNYDHFTNTPNVLDSTDVKNIFSATGDLVYNNSTGEFSIDVAASYTAADFDSDLDAAIIANGGLFYDSTTNTLTIAATGVTPGVYGSASAIPVISVTEKGQIDSISTIDVASVDLVRYDSASGTLAVETTNGLSFQANITLTPFTTDNLTEGSSNLYFTENRVTSIIDSDYINVRASVTGTVDSDYVFARSWRIPTGDYGGIQGTALDAFGVYLSYYDFMDPVGEFRIVELGSL